MECTINTTLDIGDKIYGLNSRGDIQEYHIGSIHITIKAGKEHETTILYSIYNKENSNVLTLEYHEIAQRYFLYKKDIINHLMKQL